MCVVKSCTITRFRNCNVENIEDVLLSTCSCRIIINNRDVAVFRTIPDKLEELGIGFCICRSLKPDIVHVYKSDDFNYVVSVLTYGKLSIYKRHDIRFDLSCREIMELVNFLNDQVLYKTTGATHVVLIYDLNFRRIVGIVEDYSRHAALYKSIGVLFRKNLISSIFVFILSFRIDCDLLSIIQTINVPCIISVSAITYDALDLAKRNNITLIGFARVHENRFNVYNEGIVKIGT